MEKYTEIFKLAGMLAKAEIPFEFEQMLGGYSISYCKNEKCICDIVEHRGSYGNTQNKLEIMGLLTVEESQHDSVVGFLTAKNVFNRIKKHWEESK